MGYNIVELFGREKRDPANIKTWLMNHPFTADKEKLENAIDNALLEFAQRIADGEVFGYTNAGISILSNQIRCRVEQLVFTENFKKKFGKIKKSLPWYKRLWNKLTGLNDDK